MPTCTIPDCQRAASTRSWCKTHYKRWQRHGDPLTMLAADRWPGFWSHVEKTDTCWLWTGRKEKAGYGKYCGTVAHRWAYRELVGPIPAGLTLDHLCYVRHCVNPAHLEPVTLLENVRRANARNA